MALPSGSAFFMPVFRTGSSIFSPWRIPYYKRQATKKATKEKGGCYGNHKKRKLHGNFKPSSPWVSGGAGKPCARRAAHGGGGAAFGGAAPRGVLRGTDPFFNPGGGAYPKRGKGLACDRLTAAKHFGAGQSKLGLQRAGSASVRFFNHTRRPPPGRLRPRGGPGRKNYQRGGGFSPLHSLCPPD